MSGPTVKALLTADRIIREDNGKYTLVGVFDSFNVTGFPAVLPPWGIFMAISDLSLGKHMLTLTMAHDETDNVVLTLQSEVDVREGGMVHVAAPGLSAACRHRGRYTLKFSIDGSEVASKRMFVDTEERTS